MTIFSELPNDLVEEILCRVPATSLKRLRFTCKRWNRLYKHDRRFAGIHVDKAAKEFLVLMMTNAFKVCPNLHRIIPSIEVKHDFILLDSSKSNHLTEFTKYQVFHCDGLLLCLTVKEYKTSSYTLVVWNPLNCETRWIKDANLSSYPRKVVLGYCQGNKYGSKSYKIMKFGCGRRESEIYDFRSDSWRILEDDYIRPGWSMNYFYHSVSLNGDAFMLFNSTDETGGLKKGMLRFDFSTEKSYGPLPFPYEESVSYQASVLSIVKEEKLSVLLNLTGNVKTEIWVTNKIDETKIVSWSKIFTFDLRSDIYISCLGCFLLDEEEKKLVVCCVRKYNFLDIVYLVGEDNKFTELDFGEHTKLPVFVSYVPSLVQIEQDGGNKRKRSD